MTTKTKSSPTQSSKDKSEKTAKVIKPAKAVKVPVISKNELIRRMAEKVELTQLQIDSVLNSYFETVTAALSKGETITHVGFGTFEVRQRAERTGRNPQSGETITIPATQVVGFKVGSALKKAVAGNANSIAKPSK